MAAASFLTLVALPRNLTMKEHPPPDDVDPSNDDDHADQEIRRRWRWACMVGSFKSQASPRRASVQITQ